MKEIYILLILLCFLIVINYTKNKNDKKTYNRKKGGGLLEKFNNKTSYFKIKLETTTSPEEKKIITTEQMPTGPEIKIINNTSKINDIPHENIWEIKMYGGNYMIRNTLNKLTLAYNIINDNEKEENQKKFTYNNKGYILQLVRNRNVFNIYFEDNGENKLGNIYLLVDDTTNKLIAKSDTQLEAHNININKEIEKVKKSNKTEEEKEKELEKLKKKVLNKGEFIIEPYKLNLFNKETDIITHYENFVNHFNYEKFNLMFTLHFKHIIIPKIYTYGNQNKLTNNTERYNIYPTNWVAGSNPEPVEGSPVYADRALDIRYINLYKNESQRQLLISSPYKSSDTDLTTKSQAKKDKNENIAQWNIIYNELDKTYEIKNMETSLSILQNVIKNSTKVFSNYMNNKNITFTNNQKKQITLENYSDKNEEKNYYNLSFYVTVEGETTPVKMYLSVSNWDGILVARKADKRTFGKIDKLNNIFIIKTNEEEKRTPEKIFLKQKLLGLSDEELNKIVPNTVDIAKKPEDIKKININNKYLKIENNDEDINSVDVNILRDYINNILYKKYYEKLQFETKMNTLNKLEDNILYLEENYGISNTELLENIDNIFKKSPNIKNTIEHIQYIFNIKKYTTPKYYYSNPVGEILTMGNSRFNTHNFIVKIYKKTGTGTEKKYILEIGFIQYSNNIEIPLDNIKNTQKKFPSSTSFKLEYEKPYLNVFVSYLIKNTDVEKTEGYLDINGNIIKKTDKNQTMEDFKKANSDINFEIYFPSYINPWFSVGTIDNINVKTKLNKYSMMTNSFLNKKYGSNKLIKNVKYNNKNERGEIHQLTSLKKSYTIISGQNNSIDFDNKNGLEFKIKRKSVINDNDDNINLDDILKYGSKNYIYSQFKAGPKKQNTIIGSCNNATRTGCGGAHHLDLYYLNSTQVSETPHVHIFKLFPQIDNKVNVEYGDKLWITMQGGGRDFKSQILNCDGDNVFINYTDRTSFNNTDDMYKGSLIEIISPFGKTGKILKTDSIYLKFENGKYLYAGHNWMGCGEKITAGVYANSNVGEGRDLWSFLDATTPIKNTQTGEALLFDDYFNLSKNSNEELFNIKGKNETIKVSINNKNLVITEHDVKYIDKDGTFNELEHINQVNTICSIPLIFTTNNDIILDFVPIHNQYSLTIHNGNEFINYIENIELSEISRDTIINVSDNIELKYKIVMTDPLKYILPTISSNKTKKWIIGNDGQGVGAAQGMPFNYFGTKIKNNFYRSNRLNNLYVKISSDTNELTDKLNPQTILWSDTYNSQPSDWWSLTDAGERNKIIDKVKNKFLKIDDTSQSVIYEFNQPINVSKVQFILENTSNNIHLEYYDEKTNEYKSLLKKPIDNSKNWFKSPKHYNSRSDAADYCKNNESLLLQSRKVVTGKPLGADAWYQNDTGYSYKVGEQTGQANSPNMGPAMCLNKKSQEFNNNIVAYKFRFSINESIPELIDTLTNSTSIGGSDGSINLFRGQTAGSVETKKIYNMLMKGIIGRSYPYFNIKNVGIGIIESIKSPGKNLFVNYIKDKYGTWIKVGIFKANAQESIKKKIYTTNNLSIIMDQNVDSSFSADFGELRTPEVRILGATDFENWEETRTVDWVYKVPKTTTGQYKKWKKFFEPRTAYGEGVSSYSNCWGFSVDGAYDGRGRWINDRLSFSLICCNKKYIWNENAFNVGGGELQFGSKGSVESYQLNVKGNPEHVDWGASGITSGLGRYDSRPYFFDINYNKEEQPHYTKYSNGNNYYNAGWKNSAWAKQKSSFQSAVWVLLKVEDSDIEIMRGSLDEVKTNLFNKRGAKMQEIVTYENDIKNKKKLIDTKKVSLAANKNSLERNRNQIDAVSVQNYINSKESEVYSKYLHSHFPLQDKARVYLATQYWGAYNLSSQVYEKGPYYMRKFSQSPPPYEWIVHFNSSNPYSGMSIKLQSAFNNKYLHSNTSHVQKISLGGDWGGWSSWGVWKLTWSGSIKSNWEKYSDAFVGKRVKLITGYGNANFGVKYVGGKWPLDRSVGWFLKWTTTLRIHMISTRNYSYSSSNIRENGNFNLGNYHNGVSFSQGWIIEFTGIPRSGMIIFLKSAYNNKYIHSNRNSSWSLGGRNTTYNWTLNWSGTLTANTTVYIGMRGNGGYLGNYRHLGYYPYKNSNTGWKIIWENEGETAYKYKKYNLPAAQNRQSTIANQKNTIKQLNNDITIQLPAEIKTLEQKIKKCKKELIKINEDIENNMN